MSERPTPVSPSPYPGGASDLLGRMAGEYRIRRKIGEGGFGTVYEAEHPVLKRRAAVKVLHRAAGMDSNAVQRFISEAQVANQVRSRNIVDIFSFGMLPDGRHFYVMDLLVGEPLDHYLAREPRLPVTTALQLLRPLVEALDAAHAAGIVHRDLKPQNIYLTWEPSGETVPKLLDFGLAKLLGDSPVLTATGAPMGTPLYMSPEQARGEPVDRRSDVYALGVLAYELLTGTLPITGESAVVVLVAQVTQRPRPPSEVCDELAPVLDEPILRMLEKNPANRPATAGEALRELERAAEHAGHVVAAGMPRLPRPAHAPLSERQETNASADDTWEEAAGWAPTADGGSQDRDSPRDAMVKSARAASASKRTSWPLLAAVVALGGGAFYLFQSAAAPPAGPPNAATLEPQPAAFAEQPVLAQNPAPSRETASPANAAGSSSTAEARFVQLVVRGAPAGVSVSAGDKLLGRTPGPVALPFGETPIELTLTAAGHDPLTVTVVPNRDAEITAQLTKRSPAARKREAIPRDLENPF